MNCRESQALSSPRTAIAEMSQALLHAHDDVCRESQALCTCSALHARKLPNVSGSLHPRDEILRQSQVLSSPRTTIAERLRLCARP